MLQIGAPVLIAIFAWWFSTGAILCIGRRSRRFTAWSMAVMSALALGAMWGLVATGGMTSPLGAYLSFACGLMLWGWHEMSFLFGFVTGPRRSACPTGLSDRGRFLAAFETVAYHELAILATGIVIVAVSVGLENQVGAWTYVILWLLRISAKINIFHGVPYITEQFLPAHLAYLKSYFRKDRINPLFALTVSLASLALGVVVLRAAEVYAAGDAFQTVALVLLATMLALGVLEHWFLVLPVADAALWAFALKPMRRNAAVSDRNMVALQGEMNDTTKTAPFKAAMPAHAGPASRS